VHCKQNEKEDSEVEAKLVELRRMPLAQQLSLLGTVSPLPLSIVRTLCLMSYLHSDTDLNLDSKQVAEMIEIERTKKVEQEANEKASENDQVRAQYPLTFPHADRGLMRRWRAVHNRLTCCAYRTDRSRKVFLGVGTDCSARPGKPSLLRCVALRGGVRLLGSAILQRRSPPTQVRFLSCVLRTYRGALLPFQGAIDVMSKVAELNTPAEKLHHIYLASKEIERCMPHSEEYVLLLCVAWCGCVVWSSPQ
jgi:hypothetical protein